MSFSLQMWVVSGGSQFDYLRHTQTGLRYWSDGGGTSGALSGPDRLPMDLDTVGAATVDTGTSADKDFGLDGINTGAEKSDSIWAPAIGGRGKPAV